MENKELKPCPFCGSKKVQKIAFDDCGNLQFECLRCQVYVSFNDKMEDDAIKMWNRRN